MIQIAEKCARQRHHAGGHEVQLRADLVPPEEQHREEARLEEEGKHALRRQRAPEHVAHIARIRRPVRAELELQHDARRHAEREGEREDLGPEPRAIWW
jgi:hypothetical protein